jgi:transcriptional regulator with XRE-family HTH domain
MSDEQEQKVYKKSHHVLPDGVRETFTAIIDDLDRDAYIKALRERGWTLDSIGACVGLTRERIRQICNATKFQEAIRIAAAGHFIPEPPVVPGKPKKEYVEPTPETLQRLLELQPLAQQVRSYGKQYRKEAEEYAWLINYAHTVEGVTLYRLAKRLGVTHGALRFRLARYGYKEPISGNSRAYTRIIEENRFPFSGEKKN